MDVETIAEIVAVVFLLAVAGAYQWGFRRGFYRGWAAHDREDAAEVLRGWTRED